MRASQSRSIRSGSWQRPLPKSSDATDLSDNSFNPLSYYTSSSIRLNPADEGGLLSDSIQSSQDIEDDVLLDEFILGRILSWYSAYILVISRVSGSGIFMIFSIAYVILFRPDTKFPSDLRNGLWWDHI
ncbi:hypothetical protein S40285_03845 [Stachybotrys chlorohalonatus IBT 40285]|uniref:Uncharacterized protein n=1 Tax=Stachybotrys chlorohalonatus (strain IBT 40285) TaxID=1283841 RepID=A0A084QLX1_STAC4|nr:hypothetical protein S40285_03845 [Stachybotrys chlorohalonata IBT 40285]